MKEEHYAIAAFRSRQQVMMFEQALRRSGLRTSIVTTPRAVSVGCGLSVRFDPAQAQQAAQVYRTAQPGNLIGFYLVAQDASGQITVRPLGIQPSYSH